MEDVRASTIQLLVSNDGKRIWVNTHEKCVLRVQHDERIAILMEGGVPPCINPLCNGDPQTNQYPMCEGEEDCPSYVSGM
jgi:hypothetical protein